MSLDNNFLETKSINAWASLLGLLSPMEYFVTIDLSVLWQRHVAWAKPNGKDLRAYGTQRYSSFMVVLTLMLGAEINVFFNSNVECTHMRELLRTESYGNLQYWTGILIALNACVTIIGLVATLTFWGMASSISDNNLHALCRSSIGQYVSRLPPRFVVMSLYMFILWMVLFFFSIIHGPCRIVLALVVLFLFFQVVVPLSAFGSLIIHTGAMAEERILDEDFERELLPSGLHASLIILAAGRRRKYINSINKYQRKKPAMIAVHHHLETKSQDNDTSSTTNSTSKQQERRINEQSETPFMATTAAVDILSPIDENKANVFSEPPSGDIIFPKRASVLNSCVDFLELDDDVNALVGNNNREQLLQQQPQQQNLNTTNSLLSKEEALLQSPETATGTATAIIHPHHHQHIVVGGTTTSKSNFMEWGEEEQVRNQYHATAPAMLLYHRNETLMEERNTLSNSSSRPNTTTTTTTTTTRHTARPSILNRITGLTSLRNLFERESMMFQHDDDDNDKLDTMIDQEERGGLANNCEQTRLLGGDGYLQKEGFVTSHYGGETNTGNNNSRTS